VAFAEVESVTSFLEATFSDTRRRSGVSTPAARPMYGPLKAATNQLALPAVRLAVVFASHPPEGKLTRPDEIHPKINEIDLPLWQPATPDAPYRLSAR
jgi:hypothetical protein